MFKYVNSIIVLIYVINNLDTIMTQTTCLGTKYCMNKEFCSENGVCFYDLTQQIPHYNLNPNLTNYISPNVTFLERCICMEGFATILGDIVSCCYEMKSQRIAFLLQFFVNFGAAEFYIGQYLTGMIKLCCHIFMCYFCFMYLCCVFFKDDYDEEQTFLKKILSILLISFILIYIIWWFVDLISFGLNTKSDGNGQDLSPW